MNQLIANITNWPRRKNSQIIFTATEDALLYAQLICTRPDLQDQITRYRRFALTDLKREREGERRSPLRMMDLAVRAQLYRACLEEVERISNEKVT